MKILVLHGVNLNMFGKRDPAQYGTATLADIDARLKALAAELGVEIECFQTNFEGAMVERLHKAHAEAIDGVVINPGAWTHYNYAIRDAVEILNVPVVEAHMSNINAREPFRKLSVFEGVVHQQIMGHGVDSYLMGLKAAVAAAKEKKS